jgi:flagellar secretion chaperone FliS
MNAAVAAYRQSSIDTATPGQLVVMLYDGVLTALGKVEAALNPTGLDIDVAHKELTRCQSIVSELMGTLNMSAGPVASNLAMLYEYSHRQLVAANLAKRFDPADPVRQIFTDLRDAWAQIVAGWEGA